MREGRVSSSGEQVPSVSFDKIARGKQCSVLFFLACHNTCTGIFCVPLKFFIKCPFVISE